MAKFETTYKRPTPTQFEMLGNSSSVDVIEQQRTVMLLRPGVASELQQEEECVTTEVKGNRFVSIEKLMGWMNCEFWKHADEQPTCRGELYLVSKKERKMGLGVSEVMACKQCSFESRRGKLYDETERKQKGARGCKPVSVNRQLQCGLYNTKIGNKGAQVLLTCMDTTVPSSTAMQAHADTYSHIMLEENERDMAEKRGVVKTILELKGLGRDTPVAVEADRSYNNPLRTSRRKTPGQPATQMRDTVCENVTTKKFVITNNFDNKLCKVGQRLRAAGIDPKCPDHDKCTATKSPQFTPGDEMSGGITCANRLLSGAEPMKVDCVTTDSDGKFAHGIANVMADKAGVKSEHLLDPVHLCRRMVAAFSKEQFSQQAFPGSRKDQRQKVQDKFADDVSSRAQAEVTMSFKKHHGDYKKVQRDMPYIIDAILQ